MQKAIAAAVAALTILSGTAFAASGLGGQTQSTTVATSATPTDLLPANYQRKGFFIQNNGTANISCAIAGAGATAVPSATVGVIIVPGATWQEVQGDYMAPNNQATFSFRGDIACLSVTGTAAVTFGEM